MKVKINRLWKGKYASVRDYQVKKAYQKGEDLEIICKGEKMIIPHKRLSLGRPNKQTFTSKYNNKTYYPWKTPHE